MLYLRSFNRFILMSLALFGLTVSAAEAAILNVDGGGNLLGAFGVDVGGTTFDVSFQDGTCAELFDGCDQVTDFTFQNATDADNASQALLDQIFGAGDLFDITPELTSGIEFAEAGVIVTPYGVAALSSLRFDAARNSAGPPLI